MANGLTRFDDEFENLTGNRPLAWQRRLYADWFEKGSIPPVIDLPTGLGKTMVMAIWLIARAHNPSLPRRLVYVVDRRTVVDQATDLAENWLLRKFAASGLPGPTPAISTLRGQLADTREWSRDPSRPAIIIGTVDLIGSALLFSGYRSGFKTKPLHAGLLGQDSLLVLDEAHLSKPFERLLVGRRREDGSRENGIKQFQSEKGKPMCVIRMSATSGQPSDKTHPFKLDTNPASNTYDLWSELDANGEEKNPIRTRFEAKKTLSIFPTNDIVDSVATAAGRLATDHPGSRIVIFVRTPKLVDDVRKALIKKEKARETKIAMLTGTMRGLERDELVMPPTDESHSARRVMQRFLKPDNDPSQGECFLISTSAGEVGFDLNADHMVCDAAPIDSMIQRLGRVNRRGKGEATIRLFVESVKKEKDGKPKKLEGFELSIAKTVELLTGVSDVSPKNIAALKSSDGWKDNYAAACSPEPTMVELTDILIDAWSMTSIVEPIPGRPEVAPWIRGIADELPQTTITWRAELDLPGFGQLDLEDVEEWFDTHRVLTHETLSVPTHVAAKWFTDRWGKLSETQQRDIGPRAIIVDRAGVDRITIKELIDQLSRKSGDNTAAIRNADAILPASFGGIERGEGLLDVNAPKLPKDEDKKPTDEQKADRERRNLAPDVADVRSRFREVVTKSETGEAERKPLAGGTKPKLCAQYTVTLESDDDRTVRLISYVPKIDKLDAGQTRQSLEGHVTDVRRRADAIIKAFALPENSPVRLALELAADWHDHGKNREFFQRTVNGKRSDGQRPWPSYVRGKSGGKDFGKAPRGYRHEFASLREFIDAFSKGKLFDRSDKRITQEVFDLAMHIIAVHHGRGRPHFPNGGFDPDAEDRSEEIHTESIRRFARLQRKYGHWHLAWLENLLRCADALASADPETDTDDAEGPE